MYAEFFGFTTKPFDLVPNPDFLYLGKGHKKALSYLRYGIKERAGFTLLTGEIGSGKTTLVRDIVRQVDSDTPLAMVFNTCVGADELLAMINEDFGLDSTDKGKVALLRELNDFLVSQSVAGKLPVLIIDEAQNLSAEALEGVRLLSNMETDSFKLLQIILVGQPELKNIISRSCLRQLRQRISIACHLGPLSREETEDYIYHRLAVAGNRNAVIFREGVFDRIFDFSAGVPRLVNVVCDFLLLAAFVDETIEIHVPLVREAIEELSIKPASGPVLDVVADPLSRSQMDPDYLERLLGRIEFECSMLNNFPVELEPLQGELKNQVLLLQHLLVTQREKFREIEDRLSDVMLKIDGLSDICSPIQHKGMG